MKRNKHQDDFFKECLSNGEDNLKRFYFHKDAFLVALQRNEKCAAVKLEKCCSETRGVYEWMVKQSRMRLRVKPAMTAKDPQ